MVRFTGDRVRLAAGADDTIGQVMSRCVIGEVRASAFEKLLGGKSATVGAVLRPGRAHVLLRAPMAEFFSQHTDLEDVWPTAELADLRERLTEASSAPERLIIWGQFLEQRTSTSLDADPKVSQMLSRLERGTSITETVDGIGMSHRHLARSFAQSVGLTPKVRTSLAGLAARVGYADQAHLTRDFEEFASLSPGAYRRSAPVNPRHVLVSAPQPEVRFLQDQPPNPMQERGLRKERSRKSTNCSRT